MNENRLIEEFWKDCEKVNFSKDATTLFFYLVFLRRQSREDTVYLHPATLLSKVINFTQTAVISASEELQARGYIEFTPAEGARTSGSYRFVKEEAGKRKSK
jgi:hypothetical protein